MRVSRYWLVLSLLISLILLSSSTFADPPKPQPQPNILQPSAQRGVGGFPIPRTGNQPLLVLLVEFSDRDGAYSGSQFVDFFSGSNKFVDYFTENSFGKLVYGGGGKAIDIVGMNNAQDTPRLNANINAGQYIKLPNTVAYYANSNYGNNVGDTCNGRCAGAAVRDAIAQLAATGFDFSPYATEGTNLVENLVVVFSGWSSRDDADPNSTLQPTAYTMAWTGYWNDVDRTFNGHVFNQYTLCPDRKKSGGMETIGICVHEHGHGFGLPDLYNLAGINPRGVGYIDLMGYGTWGGTGDGQTPFHVGAFSKDFLGWADTVEHNTLSASYDLGPAQTSSTSFVKVYPNGNTASNEYYLIENRQTTGFDSNFAGRGLCEGVYIWHVDQNIVDNYIYAVNSPTYFWNPPPHNGVRVVEGTGSASSAGAYHMANSDNLGECNDAWKPGQTWTNGKLHNGSSTGITVQVKSGAGNNLVVDVTLNQIVEAPQLVYPADESTVDSPYIDFEWTSVDANFTKYKFKVKQPGTIYKYKTNITPEQAGCAAGGNCTYDPFTNNLSTKFPYRIKQWRNYKWMVMYKLPDGTKAKSTWNDYFVEVFAYPGQISPFEGDTITSTDHVFQWYQSNAEINEYVVQIQNGSKTFNYKMKGLVPADLGCVVVDENLGATCSFSPSNPATNGEVWPPPDNRPYRWRVQAWILESSGKFKVKGDWMWFDTNYAASIADGATDALELPEAPSFRK